MGVSYERATQVVESVRNSYSTRYQVVVSPKLSDGTYEICAKDVEDIHLMGRIYIYRSDHWDEIRSEPDWFTTNPPVLAKSDFTEEEIEQAVKVIHGR